MKEIIETTRELCKLIQKEECYKAYIAAKEVNDKDEDLQDKIGKFNLIKFQIDEELAKEDEKDEEKIKKINEDLREVYLQIMSNESMQKFRSAKEELDKLVNNIYSMVIGCAAGEDPETAEFGASCSGNCASCGGCH